MDFITYLFWPNPGNATYGSPKAVALLIVCALLVLGSFAINVWRKKQGNAVTKKLSKSWSTSCFWFGLVGLFLVVCRVESISYLSMRILWVVWFIGLALYTAYQVKNFKSKHYEVVPQEKVEDPRDKYLPKKKK